MKPKKSDYFLSSYYHAKKIYALKSWTGRAIPSTYRSRNYYSSKGKPKPNTNFTHFTYKPIRS